MNRVERACSYCYRPKSKCKCKKHPRNIGSKFSSRRDWQAQSKIFLWANPVCSGPYSECEKNGMCRASECVDHIQPHRGVYALQWNTDNLEALCKRCHDKKTAMGL